MGKHKNLIRKMLNETEPKFFKENRWGRTHCAEWKTGASVAMLVEALASYADEYHREFEDQPGLSCDYVLGEHWEGLAHGILGLLDGSTGCRGLDCGTVNALVREMLGLEGFKVEGK